MARTKQDSADLALLQSLKVLADQASRKGFAGWSEIARRARERIIAAGNSSDTLSLPFDIGDWVSHPSMVDPVNIVGFEIGPDWQKACVTGMRDGAVASSWWHLPVSELTKVDRPKVHHLQVGDEATAYDFDGCATKAQAEAHPQSHMSELRRDHSAPLEGC